jgi:D-alanine-D-alanine ligase
VRNLRIIVLLNPDHTPPDTDTLKGYSEQEALLWRTGFDVVKGLRANDHDVRVLSVQNELQPIRDEIENFKPHVVFNLLEEFHEQTGYDQNVASYLELLRMPYTGCNPRGLMLARGKDLSKKLLHYHRIPTPAFAVFPIRRAIRRPMRLGFPLIVKSLSEDSSAGIAQASVVDSEEKLKERVTFIHEQIGTAALVEQFIDGRELYVSVLGNERLNVLPIWELDFGDMSDSAHAIATERVKFNVNYGKRRGIEQGIAKNLPVDLRERISGLVKRICRTLELDGYSRIDFRLADDGTPYFLEANPNPDIAQNEVFAQAAARAGIAFPELLDRILALGLRRAKMVRTA